ncbi:MAG: VWA domain-containing protein [Acidobacteria bacterium]|nr:MAG: VWA domain-containing protein [Acidobacteriota bacterium]
MLSLSLVGLLLLSSVLAFAQEEVQRIPVFTTDVDMVSVAIAVHDRDGNFVRGLTADQFKVYEDGVEQRIELFAAGLDESWVDLPPEIKDELSGRQVIGLIMDASGSMEDDMPLLRTAAIKFLMNIPKTENLFVMDFDENIRLSRYSSDDQRVIAERIYGIKSEGWTALYDAAATFLERVYDLDGRKTLVIFSDGVDSRSTLGVSEVFEMVKLSNVTIHSIHFAGSSSMSRRFQESRFLRQLARETGGTYAQGHSLEVIDKLFDKILDELFSQYNIAYLSSNTETNGKYRKIKVEVDVDDIKIRHRRGYFGPEREPTKQ